VPVHEFNNLEQVMFRVYIQHR